MDQSRGRRIISIPNDNPIGENQAQEQRQLLNKSQSLLMIAHRAVVNDVMERDGEFLPFGIGISTTGEYTTVCVEPNPSFPDGKKILIGEGKSAFGIDMLGIEKATEYVMLMLQNEAYTGKIVLAAFCFPTPTHSTQTQNESTNRSRMINIFLEDINKTAHYCFGTYWHLAAKHAWEFSDLSGQAMESSIFKKPNQDFSFLSL